MSKHVPLFCLFAAFALIGVAPLAFALGSAPSSGQVAVMFDPRLERVEILNAVAQADGSLVRFGGLPGTVIVDMPEGALDQLSASGAWIIADPILLGGCQPLSSLSNSNGASIR